MEKGVGPSEQVHVMEGMDSRVESSKRLRESEHMESGVGPSKRLHVLEGMAFGVGPVNEEMGRAITGGVENYDVFLSHRGPDTKMGFVSFLYEKLVDDRLQPFLDREAIVIGEDSWKCIERAIKNVPVALVIFSENFARSEWCLQELHVMLKNPGVMVLPIFYGVAPNDLRYPEGRLVAGLEELKGRFSTTDIEQWKVDLEDASRIDGWVGCGSGERLGEIVDLVKKVVGKVSELVNNRLPLSVGEYVFGIQDVAKDIIKTLDGKKEVRMLALWGMGGIGKSTLAREIYNQLNQKYIASCFVEDVKVKIGRSDVVEVQKRILKDLCKNKSLDIVDKSEGIPILERNLSKHRVLVVLDDIYDQEMVSHLITRKMLGKSSICIVTTRDKRVIEQLPSFNLENEILIHDVQMLSPEDSERVFTSYAFGVNRNVRQGFEELTTQICIACGGVPLVLKVLGSSLKNEMSMDMWEDVINMLKRGDIRKEDEIYRRLRMSYDALKIKDDQEMFLDIACALLGQLRDVAIRVWKSQGWRAPLGIRNLVKKALITIDGEGRFCMHDHLRDMGREIERGERERKRLWMPESLRLLEENEPLPDSLETLVVHENHRGPSKIDCSLSHMKRLRILISVPSLINVTLVPKSLLWFTSALRVVSASFCPEIPEEDKLVVLDVRFQEWKIFPSKRNFLALEELCLQLCEIKHLPNLQQLKRLQKLDISYSHIIEVPGLGNLVALVVFRAMGCFSLARLPDMHKLTKLQVLDLYSSPLINEVPGFNDLEALQEFSGKYEVLPSSSGFNGRMKLVKLDVKSWSDHGLPGVADWVNLEELSINCCEGVARLDGVSELTRLERLTLYFCTFNDMSCLNELTGLKRIWISQCFELEKLPAMHNLTRLESLKVEDCFELTEWGGVSGSKSPDTLEAGQPSVETLRFYGVPRLKELQDLSMFPQLRKLVIHRGYELERLTCTVPMIAFKKLKLHSCEKLKEVPDLGLFPQLRVLDIHNCPELERLTSDAPMTALEKLELKMCRKLIDVPDLSNLKPLQPFVIYGCGVDF